METLKNEKIVANVASTSDVASSANKIIIVREPYIGQDKKEYQSYSLHGVLRGKKTKCEFSPFDVGGYEVLDIVYGNENTAELISIPYEMVDEKTKKKVVGFTYELQNIDEDGMIYNCKVKPKKISDKNTLDMLLLQINRMNGGK